MVQITKAIYALGKVHMHVTVPQQQQGPALSRLRAAKDLAAERDSPFAEFTLSGAHVLRVTRGDGSTCQVQFVQIEPCPSKRGADKLSK